MKGEVISEGPKTEVWLLHWSHIGVSGCSGISFHWTEIVIQGSYIELNFC